MLFFRDFFGFKVIALSYFASFLGVAQTGLYALTVYSLLVIYFNIMDFRTFYNCPKNVRTFFKKIFGRISNTPTAVISEKIVLHSLQRFLFLFSFFFFFFYHNVYLLQQSVSFEEDCKRVSVTR